MACKKLALGTAITNLFFSSLWADTIKLKWWKILIRQYIVPLLQWHQLLLVKAIKWGSLNIFSVSKHHYFMAPCRAFEDKNEVNLILTGRIKEDDSNSRTLADNTEHTFLEFLIYVFKFLVVFLLIKWCPLWGCIRGRLLFFLKFFFEFFVFVLLA